jgi:aldehyde dehydrogenase (NAD+)
MMSKLRAGVVWANTYNKFDPTSPFGAIAKAASAAKAGCTACGLTWRSVNR